MRAWLRTVSAVVVLTAAHAAAGEPPSRVEMFSVSLGAPLGVEICQNGIDSIPSGSECAIQENFDELAPNETGYEVYFAPGAFPRFLGRGYFKVAVRSGIVQRIILTTCGNDCSWAALAALKKKFGAPGLNHTETARTLAGLKVSYPVASWLRGMNFINLYGIDGQIDEGTIVALTADEADYLRAQSNKPPAF